MPRVDSSLVPVVFDLERGLRELGIPFGIVGALVPELPLDVRPHRMTNDVDLATEQALLARGDGDFGDEAAYLCFVRAVVDEDRNRPAAARLAEERLYLRPLPAAQIPEYTTFQCRVRKWSTIRVGGRINSTSRLIGHTVEARQHPPTVEVL